MKKIIQIAGLLRWQNLLMVSLTMVLVRYSILLSILYESNQRFLSVLPDFIILIISTLLITAAGYVINDYYDVRIDRINKPDRVTVYNLISPNNAIKIHILLNFLATMLGFYLAWRIRSISFGFIFPFIAVLLWGYSAKYKKVPFWGNFIVAVLSASVVLLCWLYEFFWLRLHPGFFGEIVDKFQNITWIVTGYAVFAFLLTFIREIIKDMEDVEGDKKYDCKTIPVVLGIKKTRILVASTVAATMILLGYVQLILFRLDLTMALVYFTVALQVPALYLLYNLFRVNEKSGLHALSFLCKVIMFAGILSMEILIIST